MRLFRIILCVLLFQLFSVPLHAQSSSLQGMWLGTLQVSGYKLRIVININGSDNALTATLDSPDQGAKGIPANGVYLRGDSLEVAVKAVSGKYVGKYLADSLKLRGYWEQLGKRFPLVLEKTNQVVEVKRPQEPVKPYPYQEEEVTFENKSAGVRLAGTLTKPSAGNSFPVVILISGSGPQDRNETLMGHKPFLVIADYFTRQGIAVLRFDDRGVGGSTGNFGQSTSEDFAGDVLAAVEYLKTRQDVNLKKIGLAGHSEGGLIAPMVALKTSDVAFIVLMAGPGVSGADILASQSLRIYQSMGAAEEELKIIKQWDREIYTTIMNEQDKAIIKKQIEELTEKEFKDVPEERKRLLGITAVLDNSMLSYLTSPWMRFFLRYNPQTTLEKIKIPVLAINGSKDVQVLADINLKEIQHALKAAGNKHYEVKEFEGLNHLFQKAGTGMVNEYGEIQETISPDVLAYMSNWIKKVSQ